MRDKHLVRETALSLRAAISQEDHVDKSREILSWITQLSVFQKAETIMSFLNFRDEVNTTLLAAKILDYNKNLVLPCCAPQGELIPAKIHDLSKDLESGKWGIREPKIEGLIPIDPREIDLIFVPGAAFDLTGNRVGYGGGYYDRFLPQLRREVPKVAIAFACQVLPEIPTEPFDQKVDALITEEGVRWFNKFN